MNSNLKSVYKPTRPLSNFNQITEAILKKFERLVYRVFDLYLQKMSTPHVLSIQSCGNYFIDASCVKQNDIVYSCGVGTNIYFDEELHQAFGCELYLFDPTPIAINYMAQLKDRPYLKFYPWGVWTEDQLMPFYFKTEDQNEQQYLSVTNLLQTSQHLFLECYSLSNIMQQLSHDHIDILKMDIEGAAMPVLEKLLESDIRPQQILFELEKGHTPLLEFHQRMSRLLQQIKAGGYILYFLPRSNKSVYNFDFLAVHNNDRLSGVF